MKIIAIIFILGSFFGLKYREKVADSLGDPEWAHKIGGIYYLILFGSIFFFFWGLAMLTGTVDFLFSPIFSRLPLGGR